MLVHFGILQNQISEQFVSVYLWGLLQIIVLVLLFQACDNFKSTYQINIL